MAYVDINGVKHYYEWITESAHPGNKPTLLFVHGWAGSARYWESTARAVAADYDCLLYDMRGFGRSEAAPAEAMLEHVELGTMENFAEDLKALLDALLLKQVYLNAHSLGGSVALYFLERYPERVRKAILTCNGSFEYDEKAFEAFYRFGGYVVKFRPKWLGKIPLAPYFFMSRFLHRPIPASEKRAFLDDFLLADEATALGTMRSAVSQHATVAMPKAFAALQVPTLLVSGQHDKITPAELGRQAAEMSDRIEYVMMPKTAHFPMLEDPNRYREIMLDFLNR
ncbi:MAG: alpha/beta hydrolase [Leptolyngbya sp. SIO4C1]|nr:alpha/beta hydrolase [Leptolyngbya sp. SIO4C1]